MDAVHIVDRFVDIANQVRAAIDAVPVWGPSGRRSGQYTIDVAADEVALNALDDSGFGVLSEESGLTNPDREILVVVDPIDGSTNASAGLPWYATSLCALDGDGPLVGVVTNQATGDTWHAIRDQGAFRNGVPIQPSPVTRLTNAFVALCDLPDRHYGWRQFRVYGAAALDICSVADGTFDAFGDLAVELHGAWDYMAAMLILREAGGEIVDRHDRDLVVRSHTDRRTPIAACTPGLLAELRTAIGGT